MSNAYEQQIQQLIRISCSRGDSRLWRNNVGKAFSGKRTTVTRENLQIIKESLCVGDLVTVTRENLQIIKESLCVGDLVIRNPRIVKYGLCNGSADLIGITRGQFVSLEVKRPGGGATPEQIKWLSMVREMGGIAEIVHNIEEAAEALRAPPP
jgi:hypothetical protein